MSEICKFKIGDTFLLKHKEGKLVGKVNRIESGWIYYKIICNIDFLYPSHHLWELYRTGCKENFMIHSNYYDCSHKIEISGKMEDVVLAHLI